MSGHVFHPGHDEWHGQTVVVYTHGARTFIGRWDSKDDKQVHMLDVAVHDQGASTETRQDWVARMAKYGVPVEHKATAFPADAVDRVVRLRDA